MNRWKASSMSDDWVDGKPPPPPMGFARRWIEYTDEDRDRIERDGYLVEIPFDCQCPNCTRARG